MNNYIGNTATATELNNASVPARQPQILESFEVLEKSIEAQAELCKQLEQRLTSVLRIEPEAAENNAQGGPERTVVPIARRINDASNRLHQIANTYNSILRRLELP